jgi:glycosyltransferase
MAKFSIITCTFNSEAHIEKTLKNLYSQTFQNFEHIIVDNCSKDKTIEIIKNLSFPRRILISEKDKGIYDAFNKGIKRSTGDIVGFLHSTDQYKENDYLERIEKKFEENDSSIVYSNLSYFVEDGQNNNKIIRKWISGNFSKKKLYYGWMPPHCAMFVKNSFYSNNYYDTNYKIASDYDWILKNFIRLDAKEVIYLKNYNYLMRDGGISNKKKFFIKKINEDLNILFKRFKLLAFLILITKRVIKIKQFFI